MRLDVKKRWGKLKYWQKVGLIFTLLGILIVIKGFNCSDTTFCWILLMFTFPSILVANSFPYNLQGFVISLLLPLQYFVIGALIGILIEKIKSKK